MIFRLISIAHILKKFDVFVDLSKASPHIICGWNSVTETPNSLYQHLCGSDPEKLASLEAYMWLLAAWDDEDGAPTKSPMLRHSRPVGSHDISLASSYL